MDTSRSQDRSLTPRKRRRERDGTRESREPLGTLGFKLKQQVLIVVIIVKVNIATLYYIPRYHTTAIPTLPHSFVLLTVLQMKPMKFLSSLSRAQNREMMRRKMRKRTIPMNHYLLTHPGNEYTYVD